MAQYRVDHTCGHTETHTLYGPGKERTRKLEWLATTLCTACYRADQEARREAADAAAAEANADAGLVALAGTSKQIAWAESIRAAALAEIGAMEGRLERIPDPAQRPRVAAAIAAVRGQASAAWWIDRREVPAGNLIREGMGISV